LLFESKLKLNLTKNKIRAMNTYKKYCPNVFVAKCETEHKKNDEIILTTKYGKEHECVVFNYLGKTNDGFFLYSIIRADGFNAQERARQKAERLAGYASNAEKRSNEAYKNADLSEGSTGIPFGQPILVGHHSERRQRKVLERADNAMRKSIEESDKAKNYERRAKYWEDKANSINLSMPESLEYFEFKLEEAKKKHQFLKDNPEKRAHSYSLTYANKEVKETENNLHLAIRLWGSPEEVQQIEKEREEKERAKIKKGSKTNQLIEELGGFFAFNTEQFKEAYADILKKGIVEEGEKVVHVQYGLYIPKKNVNTFLERY
jgi:hypothetical protein